MNVNKLRMYKPVVWITGASRGIGREVAKEFASLGFIVCISARNKKQLASVAREIVELGGNVHIFPMDISNYNSIPKIYKNIQKKVGPVEVLINNAGRTSFKPFVEIESRSIKKIIETNLIGPIFLIKEVLPYMVRKKKGSIINIISMVAKNTYKGSSIYTATKSGLLGFGNVIREELRTQGVKVINVIPGATETSIWSPKIKNKYGWRMMRPKSVAEAIVNAYKTSEDLVVEEILIRPKLGDIN